MKTIQHKEQIGVWVCRSGCLLADAVVMGIAYWVAFLLRFDFQAPWWGWYRVACSFITVYAIQSVALAVFGCYKLLWRYVGLGDLPRFIGAIGSSTAVLFILRLLLPNVHELRPPLSITCFNSFLVLGGLLGIRSFVRFLSEGPVTWGARVSRRRRVLLVGAGATGNLVVRELRRQNEQRFDVIGFLDDDSGKQRASIQGCPVLGRIDALPAVVKKYAVEEVIVAMARVPRDVIRQVVRLCELAHVPARIVPGYYELIDGSLTASKIRNVDVSDLLGRAETLSDNRDVVGLLSGKRVLVTGAGGSIGSELVRQVLHAGPELVIMVDRSENAIYQIEQEVARLGPKIPTVSCLADIADVVRMTQLIERYQPQIVIHAAAYKHVPLMEQNPIEAIRNNVLATRELGELSLAHGVERFVFISTDKAVNPVSIMGSSKRMAEIALQNLNGKGATRFSAVRFGNVLGSSGSVVPFFREQIQRGGPVTVTDPGMKRYFMTISEAVSLVLQAAALAQGGEIFVLDMGEPMRIVELAEEMIALSGLRPYEDIPIIFTGIRPGEKLFEELDVSENSAYKTGHARIFISKIQTGDEQKVGEMLALCRAICSNQDGTERVRDLVRRFVSAGL